MSRGEYVQRKCPDLYTVRLWSIGIIALAEFQAEHLITGCAVAPALC